MFVDIFTKCGIEKRMINSKNYPNIKDFMVRNLIKDFEILFS
jgi:hypothetical protein